MLCKGQASRTKDESKAAAPARDTAPPCLGKSWADPVATARVSHSLQPQAHPSQGTRLSTTAPQHKELSLNADQDQQAQGAGAQVELLRALRTCWHPLRSGKPLYKPRLMIPSQFRWVKLGPREIKKDLQQRCKVKRNIFCSQIQRWSLQINPLPLAVNFNESWR